MKRIKMTEEETISWIFLPIALASKTEPANFQEISNFADGINHSIPDEKELKSSISWLSKKLLINKVEKKYQLTDLGKFEYEKASKSTKILFGIWKNLELKIIKMNENN
jgi:predicted transcriptional regulator